MSAVIAEPAAVDGAVPVKRGKRKLLIIIAAVLALILVAGGGAVVYLRKKAAQAAAELSDADGSTPGDTAHAADTHESISPPTYLPLDPFVVNLADRETDRYAQIGITLELQSPAFADQMKAYMPAVRNAILMVITRKTSRELLDPMGKEQLADEIMREAVRPMGIEIAAPEPVTAAAEPASASASGAVALAASAPMVGASGIEKIALVNLAASAPPKKPKRRGETTKNPIQHVNFSSFIIQ
jgi:flagellar FliL protein